LFGPPPLSVDDVVDEEGAVDEGFLPFPWGVVELGAGVEDCFGSAFEPPPD
jgi:hypothetical protein